MKKHCLIIGASGGIGRAITEAVVREGYTLSLHYHQNKSAIDQLAEQIPDEVVLEIIQADLSKQSGIEYLIEMVKFAPTDVIFAQGQASFGLFHELGLDVIDALNHVHVKATWLITQAYLPKMLAHRSGNIIVISSVWGDVGASYEVVYSSVKGAQNAFVKALAQEVAGNNVRINAVSPGLIDTPINQQLSEGEKQELIVNIPANRMGKVEEIAELVSFLLSTKSAYINGENIKISGAWR